MSQKQVVQVREFMTRIPVTVQASARISDVQGLMREHAVRHLPVEKNGKVIGILSDRLAKIAAASEMRTSLCAEEIMIPDPYRVAPHTPLADVAAAMAEDKYGCVLVEEGGQLRGIFTTTDACRALRQTLERLETGHHG